MRRTNINDLSAFAAVARERSFTRAAAQLGVSASALSHTLRKLEERLGLRLLARTTRSVALTEAGERLFQTVGPAFEEIDHELAALTALREKPGGAIRINSSWHAAETLRLPSSGGLYAWEFEKDGRQLNVRVDGQLIFSNGRMILEAAAAGLGLGFIVEDQASAHLADGRLKRVLVDWCPPFSGYHLYYPSRRQNSPAFSLFVDALRYRSSS
jgi:DNA-binding transcriptional LysR family regulator